MKRGIIQEHSSILTFLYKCFDAGLFLLSFLIAYRWRWGTFHLPAYYQVAMLVGLISGYTVFSSMALYQAWRGRGLVQEVRTVGMSVLTVFAVLVALAYVTKSGSLYSRQWAVMSMVLYFLFCSLFRILVRFVLRYMRSKDMNIRRVCIVGAGDLGRSIAGTVIRSPWTGLKVTGFFDDEIPEGTVLEGVEVKGDLSSAVEILSMEPVDQIWVALPLGAEEKIAALFHDLRFSTSDIRLVLDIFSFNLLNHSITEVAGIPILNISSTPIYGLNRMWKFLEDYILATAFLLLSAPLFLLIGGAIKLSSPGPVFFRQKRHGYDGKEITVYKFRTMHHVSDKGEDFRQATRSDSRITSVGRVLRSFSLDELPQFINVLQGRMSIVGPRPHPVELNDRYKDSVKMFMQRHKVLPGITGWAQVNGHRGEFTSAESVEKRIEHDLFYINNWSLLLDARIIALTLFKGFTSKNAY